MQGKASFVLRFVASAALLFLLTLLFAPAVFAAVRSPKSSTVIGPKTYYLAIGDSLAFGYQPDLDWAHGYSTTFFNDLKLHRGKDYVNFACPGETTKTMIYGGCPFPVLRKHLYVGAQLSAVVDYLHKHAGQVSPVTLDIGANDMIPDLDASKCTISANWQRDLATMDTNLTRTILPKVATAMTVNGHMTGDLLVMNYYDPYQNNCPNTVPYVEQLNKHLATDAASYATMVDVFGAFGGAAHPNAHLCTYTWMCTTFKDIHCKDAGYLVIAKAFEQAIGY